MMSTSEGLTTETRYEYLRGQKIYEKFPDGREFSYTYEDNIYGQPLEVKDLVCGKVTLIMSEIISVLALVLCLCLYRFTRSVLVYGLNRSLKQSLTPLALLFFFTSFTLFQGCYLVDSGNAEKPDWLTSDLPPETGGDDEAVTGDGSATDTQPDAEVPGSDDYVWPTPSSSNGEDNRQVVHNRSGIPEAGVLFFHL